MPTLNCPRFKSEMFVMIAREMNIPWRAAEAMHWQLGEEEIARRAGTVPFSSSSSLSLEPPPKKRKSGPSPEASDSTNEVGSDLGPGTNTVDSGPGSGTNAVDSGLGSGTNAVETGASEA